MSPLLISDVIVRGDIEVWRTFEALGLSMTTRHFGHELSISRSTVEMECSIVGKAKAAASIKKTTPWMVFIVRSRVCVSRVTWRVELNLSVIDETPLISLTDLLRWVMALKLSARNG